jgi:hypothetical protein
MCLEQRPTLVSSTGSVSDFQSIIFMLGESSNGSPVLVGLAAGATPITPATLVGPTEMAASSFQVPEKEYVFVADASVGGPAPDASFWGNDFTLLTLCYRACKFDFLTAPSIDMTVISF